MPRVRNSLPVLVAVLGALLLLPLLSSSGASAGADRTRDIDLTGADFPYRINASLLPNSKENTNAIVQNAGTGAATIVMNFYTPGGVLIPSASQVFSGVEVGGTRTFVQATNTGLTPGFRGVGVIESNQRIFALLVRDIQAPNGDKAYSIHNAFPTGGSTISLPFIVNKLDNVFSTRFAIANTGSSPACVTITYSFQTGGKAPYTDVGSGAGCATGYPIPAGGQLTFAPAGSLAVTQDGALPMPAQTAGEFMAATVESTGAPVTVSVDAYRTPGNGYPLASYDGFVFESAASTTDDHSTEILLPLVLKTPDGFYSQDLLSNPNDTDAQATITYTGSVGGGPTQTFNVPITVPANGTANYGVYSAGSPIPTGFIGSAKVSVSNGIPIAVVGFRGKMTTAGSYIYENLYTAYNGIPAEKATTKVNLPLIFRRAYQSAPFFGFNTWFSVSVADGTTANLTITTVADTTTGAPGCGNPATYTVNTQVTGSKIFYQNLDSPADNGLNATPSCLWGGTVIESDKPIVVIANVTNDLLFGDNDGVYNGFDSE